MVFFTCKNLLVILLQVYRLVVIYCESKGNDDDESTETRECRGSLSFDNDANSINFLPENKNSNNPVPKNKLNNYTKKDDDKAKHTANNRVSPTPQETRTHPTRLSWQNDSKKSGSLNHPNALSDPNTPVFPRNK